MLRLAMQLQHRGDDEVQYEAGGKEIQGSRIAAGILAKPGYDGRSDDSSYAPGREHAAMDRAELTGAEYVGQIGRHARKTAAIARYDQEYERLEQQDIARTGQQIESSYFQREEQHIGEAPAQIIGQRGPDDASTAIQQADDADHGGGGCCIHADDLLRHRRGHCQQTDAAGDIDEKYEASGICVGSLRPCGLPRILNSN